MASYLKTFFIIFFMLLISEERVLSASNSGEILWEGTISGKEYIITTEGLYKNEIFYNLSVGFDKKNYLVSLMNHVNPKIQYTNNYAHRASQSKTMKKSFRQVALKLKKRFKPLKTLEIGSNDGTFIKNFQKNKIIAVEPCSNLANITKLKGFKTYKKISKKNINS